MDELDEQKAEIKAALASAKLKENLGLKKEHIVYFLHQFANMDYTDLECQKRLIKTFINSVFVYDDKVVLTFNYSGDNRTITLMEIDAGLQQGVRLQSTVAHQKRNHPLWVVFVFEDSVCGEKPARSGKGINLSMYNMLLAELPI